MWHGVYLKSAKNQRMGASFVKKEPYPLLYVKRGVFNKITDGNNTSTLRNHITSSLPHVHSILLEMKKMIPQALVK